MKFIVKIQSASRATEHTLELQAWQQTPAGSGRVGFVMDGDSGEAAWAEVEPGVYSLLAAEQSYVAIVRREPAAITPSRSCSNGGCYQVLVGEHAFQVEMEDSRARRQLVSSPAPNHPLEILAPMPGRVVKILAVEHAEVAQGAGLLVIEAMKMQNEIRAPRSGQVDKIHVQEGDGVEAGARLLSFA